MSVPLPSSQGDGNALINTKDKLRYSLIASWFPGMISLAWRRLQPFFWGPQHRAERKDRTWSPSAAGCRPPHCRSVLLPPLHIISGPVPPESLFCSFSKDDFSIPYLFRSEVCIIFQMISCSVSVTDKHAEMYAIVGFMQTLWGQRAGRC